MLLKHMSFFSSTTLAVWLVGSSNSFYCWFTSGQLLFKILFPGTIESQVLLHSGLAKRVPLLILRTYVLFFLSCNITHISWFLITWYHLSYRSKIQLVEAQISS